MAIKVNENYIKINIDRCSIVNNDSLLSYTIYDNESDRLIEKEYLNKFNKFLSLINNYITTEKNNITIKLEKLKKETGSKSMIDVINNLDNDTKVKIDLLNSIYYSYEYVRIHTFVDGLYDINIPDIFYSYGFEDEWKTKILNKGTKVTKIIDKKVNINNNTMYSELKKLFENNGYEDC